MTTEAAIGKAVHAAVGLACAIAAKVLPWDRRSQHDAWCQGYVEGLKDGAGAGRCGDQAPTMFGSAPQFCGLRHGHHGWHKADDGSEWNVSSPTATS